MVSNWLNNQLFTSEAAVNLGGGFDCFWFISPQKTWGFGEPRLKEQIFFQLGWFKQFKPPPSSD